MNGLYSRLQNKPETKPVPESTSQPTPQSTEQGRFADLTTVSRPKAFYISTQVDEWLDDAVRYFKKQGIQKADRSTILNAVLHDKKLWQKRQLAGLRTKVLEVLTSQLTS